jgi:hypothetical protein
MVTYKTRKKYRGGKVNFLYEISKSLSMLSSIFIFGHLTFNPTLQKIIYTQLDANLGLKRLNDIKKKFENQIKNFVKINYFNSQ